MVGESNRLSRVYTEKLRGTSMRCIAIINTHEELGLPKTLGKKKLKECGMRMKQIDDYVIVCTVGHRLVTQKWENKSFQDFFSNNKGRSKV